MSVCLHCLGIFGEPLSQGIRYSEGQASRKISPKATSASPCLSFPGSSKAKMLTVDRRQLTVLLCWPQASRTARGTAGKARAVARPFLGLFSHCHSYMADPTRKTNVRH